MTLIKSNSYEMASESLKNNKINVKCIILLRYKIGPKYRLMTHVQVYLAIRNFSEKNCY